MGMDDVSWDPRWAFQPGTRSGPGAVTSTVTHYTSALGRARTQELMPHTQAKQMAQAGLEPKDSCHTPRRGRDSYTIRPPRPEALELWAGNGALRRHAGGDVEGGW